jgi:hypothetical protein
VKILHRQLSAKVEWDNPRKAMPSIGINNFVRRQTATSEFTHFDDGSGEESWDRVAALAEEHLGSARPGYRDGVVLVPVPPEHFFTGLVVLLEGDQLVGEYKARRPGEEPRKSVRAARVSGRLGQIPDKGGYRRRGQTKARCVAVDLVLYHRDVLVENGEATTDCEWEIVSVNGRITEDPAPIEPMTLIANHFQLSGGTATNMSPEQFEKALRESVMYWKDKAFVDV